MKVAIAVSISLLWMSSVNACIDDFLSVISDNTYLMSEPGKNSKLKLKLPKGSSLLGCIDRGKSSPSYKTDKFGNGWDLGRDSGEK